MRAHVLGCVTAILAPLLPLGMATYEPQSRADACKLLEKPLNDAGFALVDSAQNGDATNIADTYAMFATTYEEASERVTGKEIKESVDQIATGWRAVTDNSGVLKTDLLSMDVQELEGHHKVMEDLSARQTELFSRCGYQRWLVTKSNIAIGDGPMGNPQSLCDQ